MVKAANGVIADLQHVAEGKHNRRALMLVTDGNDTSSSVNLETTLNLARKSEVLFLERWNAYFSGKQ